MANLKISELNAYTEFATNDLFAIVDTSATETKKVTITTLDSRYVVGDNANHITFNTSPTDVPTDIGTMSWNSTDNTLDLIVSSTSTLQIGQEGLIYVKNNSGAAISNGEAVYIDGATGSVPTIEKAQANTFIGLRTIGLATADIPNGSNGFVAKSGYVRGLDTSAYTEGDPIWLSADTAGGWVGASPAAPSFSIFLGVITDAHPLNGVILVEIRTGYSISTLNDVSLSSLADNQVLQYDEGTSLWKNVTLSHTELGDIGSNTHAQIDTHIASTANPHSVTKAQVGLGNVEDTALSTWAGSANITTLGTISTGVWNGTALLAAYVPAHDDLTGFVANEHLDWTQASVGTIHATNYVDNDTTDHTLLSNIGTNSHAQIDTHIADSTIHFTESSIDHGAISGLSDDDHTQYSLISSGAGAPSSTPSRVGEIYVDTTADKPYFSVDTVDSGDWVTGGVDDHTLLSNIGTNTHAQIDSHIAGAYTDPLTTRGDLLYRSVSATTRLPVGTNGQVLGTDGTDVFWTATGAGSGDVVGPSSATDNAIARFDSTTGKLIQNSVVTLSDTDGDMVFPASATIKIGSTDNNAGLAIKSSNLYRSLLLEKGTGANQACMTIRDGANEASIGLLNGQLVITSGGFVNSDAYLQFRKIATGTPHAQVHGSNNSNLYGKGFFNAELNASETDIVGFHARIGTASTAGHNAFRVDDATPSTVTTFTVDFQGNTYIAGDTTMDGDLTVNTTDLHVDTTNSRVGIGTASPDTLLDVESSGGGTLMTVQGVPAVDGTTPVTLQIKSNQSGTWTDNAEWANLDFYSSDASGSGAGVKARISAITNTTGGAVGLKFSQDNGSGLATGFRFDSSSRLQVGPDSFTGYGRISAEPLNASQRGLYIKGYTSQTANLLEIDDSAESSLFEVSASGDVTASGDLTVNSTDLHVDTTNSRVGVGTASPSDTLHVAGHMLGDISHAENYESNNTGSVITLTTGGTYYGWTTATEGLNSGASYADFTGDATADRITIGSNGAGRYKVDYYISFEGSASETFTWCLHKNGTAQTKFEADRTMGTSSQTGSFSFSGFIDLVDTDYIDLRVKAANNSKSVTVYHVMLNATRIAR